MKRPTTAIEKLNAGTGSPADAAIVGDYIRALEANCFRLAFSIRNARENGKPHRTITQKSALRKHDELLQVAEKDDLPSESFGDCAPLLPFPTVLEGGDCADLHGVRIVGCPIIRAGASTHTGLPLSR